MNWQSLLRFDSVQPCAAWGRTLLNCHSIRRALGQLRAPKPVVRNLGPCSRKRPFTEFRAKALTGEKLILAQGIRSTIYGTDQWTFI